MKTILDKSTSIKKLLVASLAWGFIITGCSDTEQKKVVKPSFKIESLAESAWLYGSLPENTVAYVRLPNPWSGFSAKADSFKYALGNEEHVKAVKKIQQGVYDNIIAKLQAHAKPLAQFYVEHTKGPVELAFVSQNGQPVVFAGTSLDYSDDTSFNTALQDLVKGIPNANLMPQEGQAKGIISFGPGAAVYYSYNSDKQRFTLVSGMGTSVTSLENAAATIKPNDKHEMLKLEKDIDSSHQGLFVWASPKNAMPFIQMGMPPEKLQQLKELGVDQAKGLALGYGVSDSKTRLKLLLDMPNVGARQFLPVTSNDYDIKSVGQPSSVLVMSWFTAEQIDQFKENMELVKPGFKNDWENFADDFEKQTGQDFDILLRAFGPEVVRINDEVGVYWIFKHDKDLFPKVIESYKTTKDTEYSKKEINGLSIHHIKSPMIPFGMGSMMQPKNNFGAELAKSMKSHMYFSVEGDYIVYATVPQILIERHNRVADTNIASWMSEQQGFRYEHTLLGYTTSIKDISRTSYHYYLELLNQLGDISKAGIDLTLLPTAEELGFPEKGAVGISLISSSDQLGFEFTFENGATDLMVGAGGATAVAVVGILAAVAIPAYQEYTIRAELSPGVYTAESVKSQVSEALVLGAKVEDLDNGFEDILTAEDYETSVIEKIAVNDGVITVFFKSPRLGYGPQTIVYVPMFEGNQITYWDCTGGTVAQKYRPARCK
ncbi:pilin [Kangiella sp. HD9-110m-PIT-SAG07]|nr:pilin [Kangiella sp. HD9-110m-PIT-SAG07]